MKFDPPYFKGLNLDYKAEMLLGNLTLSNLGNLATFTIHLERKFLRDVVEIIGPATLLVLVSWVRFFEFKYAKDDDRNESMRFLLTDEFHCSTRCCPWSNGSAADPIPLHDQHFEQREQ